MGFPFDSDLLGVMDPIRFAATDRRRVGTGYMSSPRPPKTTAVSPAASAELSTTRRFAIDWLPAGLLVWMFLACCFPLFDTDLFWHLKTGEWILQNLTIPGYDLYTFTDFDKRWIDLHWGFEVGAAILYRIGGANLLILAKAGILMLALGIGCYAGGPNLRGWQRVLCWVLPAITISGRGYERPEIITVLCLASWLWIIPRLELRPRLIWWLPALQVFWINCHALYILGLVVGGCYAVDYIARSLAEGKFGLAPAPLEPGPSTVIRAAGLCAAAALVNPYFEEGALFPFVLFRKFTVEQEFYSIHIGEFQKPINFLLKNGFVNLYLNAEILLWVAAAVSFVWLAARGRVNVFRSLLFVGFSYLAWKASRNTNIFSIIAGYVLTENVGEIIARNRGSSSPELPRSLNSPLPQRVVGVVLVMMIAAVVTGEWNRWAEKIRPFRLGEIREWFPHKAALFMRHPGYPQRVFAANFGVASVYTYYNGPQGKVFMDGRLEVCTQQTFERYNDISLRMSGAHPSWAELLRDQAGNLPAVMLDSRFSRHLISGVMQTPGWRLVYADPSCAVFFDEKTADAFKLSAVDPEPLKLPPKLGS